MKIALKKKVQSVMTEMYRIITNDWKSSVGALHRGLDAFSYDGWVKYLDVMTGKSISNFNKPEDLSDKSEATSEMKIWKHVTIPE